MSTESLRSASRSVFTKFTENDERVASDGTVEASHLCLLIHGLWGNPKHLSYLAASLRTFHPAEQLHILVAKTNSDNLTYDGIDVGGQRVAKEVENYIDHLHATGKTVKKLSIVGYSLGGLIARYVVGLLYAKGFFQNVEAVNFTTFASPHLGVRVPGTSYGSKVWNFLGSSTLSASGRQMFLCDSETPLLCLLADNTTPFMKGLRLFKNRVLYANIVNDRSTPYYTSSISRCDPFSDIDNVLVNYSSEYDPVILDDLCPITGLPKSEKRSFSSRLRRLPAMLQQIPWFLFFTVFTLIGVPIFLINSVIQTFRSTKRIRLHSQSGSQPIRFFLEDDAVDVIADNLRSNGVVAQGLPNLEGKSEIAPSSGHMPMDNRQTLDQIPGTPLALSKEQLEIISALDGIGFRKHRVHIHKVRHSHAAIIVRPRPAGTRGFSEGEVVIKHWLEEEFEI